MWCMVVCIYISCALSSLEMIWAYAVMRLWNSRNGIERNGRVMNHGEQKEEDGQHHSGKIYEEFGKEMVQMG